MAREAFDTCPKCGVGKMKPTGGAAATITTTSATVATSTTKTTNPFNESYYYLSTALLSCQR